MPPAEAGDAGAAPGGRPGSSRMAKALGYPVTDDQDGDALKVGSGELAIFSAAIDGTGPRFRS